MEAFDLVVVGIGEVDDGFAVFDGGGDALDVLEADAVAAGIDVAEIEETPADEAADAVVGDGNAADRARLAIGDVEHASSSVMPCGWAKVASSSGPSWIDSTPVPAEGRANPVAGS